MGVHDIWTRQRRPIWIVLLLFIAGAFAIVIWHPDRIVRFPRKQFLEWYSVSGLLLIGLIAAIRGDTTYASMFALYALAFMLLVAAPVPELLAQLGALVCLVLGVLFATTAGATNADVSTANE
jgi:drug/metabolite transporter superfamily protein YnfA